MQFRVSGHACVQLVLLRHVSSPSDQHVRRSEGKLRLLLDASHLIPVVALLVVSACTGGAGAPIEAGPRTDAGRICRLAAQLELVSAAGGTCAAEPSVIIVIAPDGTVDRASGRVPVGVTVPTIACTSRAAVMGTSCTWDLDVVCDGANGEHLAVTGTITGSGNSWVGDSVAIEMTGSPPGRLMCAATGAVTTL